MTKEQRKQPTTINREDLYRQIWETPASLLCARYGISGRGLKKICDRLHVPSHRAATGRGSQPASGSTVALPDAAPGIPLQVTITRNI